MPSKDSRGKAPVEPTQNTSVPARLLGDYGFRSQTARLLHQEGAVGEVPGNLWEMGMENFARELAGIRTSTRFQDFAVMRAALPKNALVSALFAVHVAFAKGLGKIDLMLEEAGALPKLEATNSLAESNLSSASEENRKKLLQLKLSNEDVARRDREREKKREEAGAQPPAFIMGFYTILCVVLDVLYYNRPIQKFWVLETVARIPYFSYISILHLYETLGWWRQGAELRKVHFAEEWNELQHLSIMESLGGDQLWLDRFVAQHAAVVYYWILVLTYMVSPKLSYQFSELVEGHATDTYEVFLETNRELLMSLPPPKCAVDYYKGGDLYMFDAFQTDQLAGTRRPEVNNLYDVFCNIRDDEIEHEKTMLACQDPQQIASSISARLKSAGLSNPSPRQ